MVLPRHAAPACSAAFAQLLTGTLIYFWRCRACRWQLVGTATRPFTRGRRSAWQHLLGASTAVWMDSYHSALPCVPVWMSAFHSTYCSVLPIASLLGAAQPPCWGWAACASPTTRRAPSGPEWCVGGARDGAGLSGWSSWGLQAQRDANLGVLRCIVWAAICGHRWPPDS